METIYANMFYYNGWESGKWEVLNGVTSYKFICGADPRKTEFQFWIALTKYLVRKSVIKLARLIKKVG